MMQPGMALRIADAETHPGSDACALVQSPPAPVFSPASTHPHRPREGLVLLDLVRLLVSPVEFFTHLAERNRYLQALLLLVFFQVLFGSAVLSTGVADHEEDLRTQERFGKVAKRVQEAPAGDSANQPVEAVEKEAAFAKLLIRLGWLLGGSVRLLVGLTMVTGFLFIAVSMAGRKVDVPLLTGVVVYASCVEIVRMAVVLFLIWQTQTTRINTSAAVWFRGTDVSLPAYLLLRRLDPFALWYWGLVGLGLSKTGQLRVGAACRTVALLAALTVLAQAAGDFLILTNLKQLVLGF
jgi:hypothetical protein